MYNVKIVFTDNTTLEKNFKFDYVAILYTANMYIHTDIKCIYVKVCGLNKKKS